MRICRSFVKYTIAVVELIAVPTLTFFALIGELAKREPDHAPVAKLLGCVLGVAGLTFIGFSLLKTIKEWQETATWGVALELLIPILLSVAFLPFLYGWRAFVAYSSMFTTISNFGIDEKHVAYARWLAITRIRGDLNILDRRMRPSSISHMGLDANHSSSKL